MLCAILCHSSNMKNPNLSFHKISVKAGLRGTWMNLLGIRKERLRSLKVCSLHIPGGKKLYGTLPTAFNPSTRHTENFTSPKPYGLDSTGYNKKQSRFAPKQGISKFTRNPHLVHASRDFPSHFSFSKFFRTAVFHCFPPYAWCRTCRWGNFLNYLLRIDLGYMLSRLFITKPKFEAVKHKLLSLNQRLLSDWPLVFISTSFNFCFEEYKFSLTNGANSGFGRYFILSVKLQFLCSAKLFPILEHYIVYLLLYLLQLIAFLISNCWENHCIPTSQ